MSKKITLLKQQRTLYTAFFCIVNVLFFNGCVLQRHTVTTVDHNAPCSIDEARFVDLPIPLSFSLQSVSKVEAGCFFIYTTTESLNDCVCFYEKEMDFCGWQKVGFLQSDVKDQLKNSCALLFEKPSRYCFIYGEHHTITLFLLSKIKSDFLMEE